MNWLSEQSELCNADRKDGPLMQEYVSDLMLVNQMCSLVIPVQFVPCLSSWKPSSQMQRNIPGMFSQRPCIHKGNILHSSISERVIKNKNMKRKSNTMNSTFNGYLSKWNWSLGSTSKGDKVAISLRRAVHWGKHLSKAEILPSRLTSH